MRFKLRILFGITCLSQYLNGLRREVFSGIILDRCLVGYSKPFYVHLFGNNYLLYTVLKLLFPVGDIKGKKKPRHFSKAFLLVFLFVCLFYDVQSKTGEKRMEGSNYFLIM